MKILVTGFEPFGGQTVNPSWLAVRTLPEEIGSAQLVRAELPVEWSRTGRSLLDQIEKNAPDAILLTGQAGGADCVRIERVGLNLCDSASPDNAGEIRRDTPVAPGAPAAIFSTFDYARILSALTEAGLPARYSYSAGTYLCNCALFTALNAAPGLPVGFIHLPWLPEQNMPGFSMPLEEQTRALYLAVRAMTRRP